MKSLLSLLVAAMLAVPIVGCEMASPTDDNAGNTNRSGITDPGQDRPDGSEPMQRDRDFDDF